MANKYDFGLDYTKLKPEQEGSFAPTQPTQGLDLKSMGQAGAAGGGSVAGTAGGMLMASGNPYAMAGGAGLMAFSAVQKRKSAEKQQEYQARLQRQQNQQSAINNMINVAQGIRNL